MAILVTILAIVHSTKPKFQLGRGLDYSIKFGRNRVISPQVQTDRVAIWLSIIELGQNFKEIR